MSIPKHPSTNGIRLFYFSLWPQSSGVCERDRDVSDCCATPSVFIEPLRFFAFIGGFTKVPFRRQRSRSGTTAHLERFFVRKTKWHLKPKTLPAMRSRDYMHNKMVAQRTGKNDPPIPILSPLNPSPVLTSPTSGVRKPSLLHRQIFRPCGRGSFPSSLSFLRKKLKVGPWIGRRWFGAPSRI